MNQNSQPPTVDDRTQSDLQAELTALAEQYIDDWNPETADMVDQLLAVGAEFGSEVVQRLNRLPEKHRTAFLETLGKQPQPPQAARLPLSVEPAGEIDRNVQIPDRTQVVAETRDDETTVFEIPPGSGFEATPASLTDVYAVDPTRDRITSHNSLANGERQQLFVGENHQQHALYLGDGPLFKLNPGAILEIELRGAIVAGFEESVVWEYYGTKDRDTESTKSGEGWHRLPLVDTAEEPPEPRDTSFDDETTGYTTRRRLPGEFVETIVGETECRWLRCRLIEPAEACFNSEIERVSVATNTPHEREQSTPEAAFVDDVPLAVDDDGDIEPLGQFPQPSSTLYLSDDEALSKPGSRVKLSFVPPVASGESTGATESAESTDNNQTAPSDQTTEHNQPTDDPETTDEPQIADFGVLEEPPAVSWEYWNGSGWSRLSIEDGTRNLQDPGEITFTVPEDIGPTAVAGHEAYWIRGRLVSGSYGDLGATLTSSREGSPERPRFSSITVGYDHPGSNVSALFAENNGHIKPWSTDDRRPFEPLAEATQTVYFGFDGPLRYGPIPLFVALEETWYPAGFDPGVQWEYCVDPATDTWTPLSVEDGTNGLTERGVVRLRFSEQTGPTDLFGTRRNWIRAVMSEANFDVHEQQPVTQRDEPSTASHPGHTTTARPPTIEGIYPNTQWADNARTIEAEILGSSDGSANQQFECAHAPLLECELWVDESAALSKSELADLQATDPERLDIVTDSRGKQTAVWVRWQPVDRLCDGDTRVYQLDRTDGTIQFGDGDCGKIPPQGVDAIRATYRSGGGAGGNVPAGAVETLKTPISLVESVSNPFAGTGGTPIEPTAAVGERAAGEIRSRGRAVTPRDYEQLATSTVRTLARVRCQPNRGPDGSRQPGSVRLLVVPDENRERPTPSLAVKTRLEATVTEAAPGRLTEGSASTLSVCGPTYIPCDVTVTVSIDRGGLSQLERELRETLSTFLHPLDGNGGEGWPFGNAPTVAAISRRIREMEGVTGVRALSATLTVDGEQHRLEAASQPPLPTEGLVCSGSHRITLEHQPDQTGGRQ